jgi:very-short-patch-repair endonuclease
VSGYSGETLIKAQRLRRQMTEAEQRLWSILRGRQLGGAKFRRQQPIGQFIADFVCQDHRLIIEADGGQHTGKAVDSRRTAFLESKGYRVLRFWNNEIISNLEGVAEEISIALSFPHPARASRESPSPSRGEGFGDLHG